VTRPTFRDATAEQHFTRDGFACLDLIAAGRVERLRAVFDRFAERYDRDFLATLLIPDPGHRRAVHEALAVEMDPLVDVALSGYRPVFWGFAVKRPGEDGEVSLHQDITFLADGGRPGITLWAPLVDVASANGCLSLVPGSHRTNDRPRGPGTPFPYPEAEEMIRERYLVEVPALAGTAIAMDQRTFHCSPPNAGGAPRPAVTGILLPAEQSLRYYHRTTDDAGPCLEGFVVDDGFLLRHLLGFRPDGAQSLGIEPEAVAELHTEVMTRKTW
jgi:hypothetical protein